MAAWNLSRDVNAHRDHSGSSSRPPLPLPDNRDNVRPPPLWERGFCQRAYGITWENFCEKKQLIGLYSKVMDWDDSGALKSFLDAKERFRARYHSEPYEDPVLDPDMFIDEVDHECIVDPKLVAELDKVPGLDDMVAAQSWWGGMAAANLVPPGWGEPEPNLKPTGWGEPSNPTPETAWGGIANANLVPPGWGGPYPNMEPTGWGDPTDPIPEPAWGGMDNANLVPPGWGEPVPDLEPTGWGEPSNPTPEPAWGSMGNANLVPPGWGEPVPNLEPTGWGEREPTDPTAEVVRGAQPYSTPKNRKNSLHGGGPSRNSRRQEVGSGQTSSRTAREKPGGARNWNSGGGGGGSNWRGGGRGRGRGRSGRGSNWRGGGGGNQRIQDEGQRSGGRQHQGQGGVRRRMEWRPVQRNQPPQDDDPAA